MGSKVTRHTSTRHVSKYLIDIITVCPRNDPHVTSRDLGRRLKGVEMTNSLLTDDSDDEDDDVEDDEDPFEIGW